MDSGLKVLVVDDDVYLLDLMIETLSTIGYKAEGASSGEQALNLLRQSDFHLIITDIKMPEMDGIEFARNVRREYPEIPVIFISGAFTPSVLRQIDGQPFLPKPFRISQIEKVIDTVVSVSSQQKEDRATESILVVDDDDSFRMMLIESLKISGYPVIGAADGTEAIEHLKRETVSAVITDVKMPGMDGISLSKYIHQQWPSIPVVLITAYLNFDDADEVRLYGADGYLMKPFRIESITSLLEKLKSKAMSRTI